MDVRKRGVSGLKKDFLRLWLIPRCPAAVKGTKAHKATVMVTP
jgi:hypothetical protein